LAEAEQLLRRDIALREERLGAAHPDVAAALNSLAELYRLQRLFTEAEPMFRRALAIWEKAAGMDSDEAAGALLKLAATYRDQERFGEARPLFVRALTILEKSWGAADANVAVVRRVYAKMLRGMGDAEEAGRQEKLAEAAPSDRATTP
jgi:tetratricopeptide (TPR) repeat protein